MKRLICIVSISLSFMTIFADVTPVMFEGIFSELNGENTEDTSIEDQIEYIYSQYSDGETAVIAHSQGGVRALGFASKMSKEGKQDNLKAIITIGSPVKGYSPLLLGREKILDNADNVVGTLSKGITGIIGADMTLSTENVRDILDFCGFENELLDGVIDGSLYEKAGIKDLNPNSVFFRDHIDKELTSTTTIYSFNWVKVYVKTVTQVKYKTYKILWKKIKIPYYVSEKIYEYKWVKHVSNVIKHYANRISSDIPIGFVIGYENNPLSLIVDEEDRVDAQDKLDSVSDVLGSAAKFWDGFVSFNKGLDMIPFVDTGDNIDYGRRNKSNCKAAKELIDNPETILPRIIGGNTSLFVSNESTQNNDCFILEADQSRPLNNLGGKPIGPDGEYKSRVKANHINETYHKDIWGGDGNLGTKTGDDIISYDEHSLIYKWLSHQDILETTGVVAR